MKKMSANAPDEFEKTLSYERFNRYLGWAGGDRQLAIELYTLNAKLSESLFTPLHMLEVALRNRIYTVLSESVHDHWFDEAEYQKGLRQAEQLAKAKADLAEENKDSAPDRVVAALTFGYWTAFFGADYEEVWRKNLHKIAQHPEGTPLRRKNFSSPLTPIRALRNRIAHHEPILAWNLPKHYGHIIELTEWLSPSAAEWSRNHSRFLDVYPVERVALHTSDNAADD
jgi:hypothetical protein